MSRRTDPNRFKLTRFLTAQEETYTHALSDIKQFEQLKSEVIYIFPQLQGLSLKKTQKYYQIKDLPEAAAYLEHPVLGARMVEICLELINIPAKTAIQVFGSDNAVKFQASMTLFSQVKDSSPVFGAALYRYFDGEPDGLTLRLLNKR